MLVKLSILSVLFGLSGHNVSHADARDVAWFGEVGGIVMATVIGEQLQIGSIAFPFTRCDSEVLSTCLNGEQPLFRPAQQNVAVEYEGWTIIETSEFDTGADLLTSEEASVIYLIRYDQPGFIYYVNNDRIVMIAEVEFSDPGEPGWYLPHPGEEFELTRMWVAVAGEWTPFD